MQKISEIEELIKSISKLPGLGPKSATRIILKLINNRRNNDAYVKIFKRSFNNVSRCNSCGSLMSVNKGYYSM